MGSLIGSQITRSTVIDASRPRLTMPLSAALDVIAVAERSQIAGRSQTVSACSTVQQQRSDLLIIDLSTTNPAGVSRNGSSKPFGDAAKGALGAYAMGVRSKTRLGSRPPSPPV